MDLNLKDRKYELNFLTLYEVWGDRDIFGQLRRRYTDFKQNIILVPSVKYTTRLKTNFTNDVLLCL